MNYRQEYVAPFAKMMMSSDGVVLTGLWFTDSFDDTQHRGEFMEKDLPILRETAKWLDLYFAGKHPDFTPAYRLENLTPFRKQVVDAMCQIPYGQTVTYNDIAKVIAKQKGVVKMSAQAVGGAVGWNPLCIIIPCHRVVGANGNLIGYSGGLKNKIKLLELERKDMKKFIVPTKGTRL